MTPGRRLRREALRNGRSVLLGVVPAPGGAMAAPYLEAGTMARPEEIAKVVGFLAGGAASYLAATTIFADGGIMHSSVGL